jgi:hypothetical protein
MASDYRSSPIPLDFIAAMTRAMPWTKDAACRGEPENLFFADKMLDDGRAPGSPSLLVPLLICETCPVRRPCLEDALTPRSTIRIDETATGRQLVIAGHGLPTAGIWGGSTEIERLAVKTLPLADAANVLERTLPVRIEKRIAAFECDLATVPHASSRGRPTFKRGVELIAERKRVRDAA